MEFGKQSQRLHHYLLPRKHTLPYLSLYTRYCGLATKPVFPEIRQIKSLYEDTIALAEAEFYQSLDDSTLLALRELFNELDQLLTSTGFGRYEFTAVIPVADRPKHLINCLKSLLCLSRSFPYGGSINSRLDKVQVFVADDSQSPYSIKQIQETIAEFNSQGLMTCHIGIQQQREALEALSGSTLDQLNRIIGNRAAYFHRGPSIVRNILYLLLKKSHTRDKKSLFWFLDSDQEFQVRVRTRQGGYRDVYSLNYFYYLDQLFAERDITVLTGKVVGSPPVSPAVMAGNCLEDVLFFLHQASRATSQSPCPFHSPLSSAGQMEQQAQQAAYHDMAELFGFTLPENPSAYVCPIEKDHQLNECVAEFSQKLTGFFYGDHPTRQTSFVYKPVLESIVPARTVYTGNYVLTQEGLKFFIPFATLRLRMAGPVLGRLVRAELGQRFVSANLPMLHKRTLNHSSHAEFRSGISSWDNTYVDLSGEFERQFYGDVMLFTVEKLIETGFPKHAVSFATIRSAVNETGRTLLAIYQKNQHEIQGKLKKLWDFFHSKQMEWFVRPGYSEAVQNFNRFLYSMHYNFGTNSTCYTRILSTENQEKHFQAIAESLCKYKEDVKIWEAVLMELDML